MGVMTAVVGGIIRDVVCNEVPLILRRDVYATAAFAGAVGYVRWTSGQAQPPGRLGRRRGLLRRARRGPGLEPVAAAARRSVDWYLQER
jgi:hypothetical protein